MNTNYFIGKNANTDKKLEFKTKKEPYTITEIIKIYEIVGTLAKDKTGFSKSFWEKYEDLIPNRSAESLKTIWKKYHDVRFEDFIRDAESKNMPFSHEYKEIPEIPTFVEKFKDTHGSKGKSPQG